MVRHRRRHQRRQPALLDGDGAVVDHHRVGTARDGEVGLPGHEALVGGVGCRHHQRIDVDLAAPVEHHAGAVDQNDIAVGDDVAGDLRRVPADHPVQRDGAAAGLHEIHGLGRADIEALPVHRGALARLLHRGDRGGLADAGLSRHHQADLRPGVGRKLGLRRKGKHHQHRRLQRGAAQQRCAAAAQSAHRHGAPAAAAARHPACCCHPASSGPALRTLSGHSVVRCSVNRKTTRRCF